MDWSRYPIPPTQLKARFGDRVVPVFCERPRSIWAMVSEAAARNPDREAFICGDVRMNWREVVRRSASIAAGLRNIGVRACAIGWRCCLAIALNLHW